MLHGLYLEFACLLHSCCMFFLSTCSTWDFPDLVGEQAEDVDESFLGCSCRQCNGFKALCMIYNDYNVKKNMESTKKKGFRSLQVSQIPCSETSFHNFLPEWDSSFTSFHIPKSFHPFDASLAPRGPRGPCLGRSKPEVVASVAEGAVAPMVYELSSMADVMDMGAKWLYRTHGYTWNIDISQVYGTVNGIISITSVWYCKWNIYIYILYIYK